MYKSSLGSVLALIECTSLTVHGATASEWNVHLYISCAEAMALVGETALCGLDGERYTVDDVGNLLSSVAMDEKLIKEDDREVAERQC